MISFLSSAIPQFVLSESSSYEIMGIIFSTKFAQILTISISSLVIGTCYNYLGFGFCAYLSVFIQVSFPLFLRISKDSQVGRALTILYAIIPIGANNGLYPLICDFLFLNNGALAFALVEIAYFISRVVGLLFLDFLNEFFIE